MASTCPFTSRMHFFLEEKFQQHEDMGQYHHTEAGNTFHRKFGLADLDSGFSKHTQVSPLPHRWLHYVHGSPLLQAMPADMMIATDLPTLMALNTSLRLDPKQGSSDPMEVWAAMAARFSSSLSKPDEDPGVAMARTLASLR